MLPTAAGRRRGVGDMRGARGMKKLLVAILFMAVAGSTYAQTTDLRELVSNSTSQQVQAAIKQGADVNTWYRDGSTPLMDASAYNPIPEMITLLLKAGADLEARNNGGSALILAAAINQNPEEITTLVEAGTDLEAQDSGYANALMRAAAFNQNPPSFSLWTNPQSRGFEQYSNSHQDPL